MLAKFENAVKAYIKNAVYYNRNKDKMGLSRTDFFKIKNYSIQYNYIAETLFLNRPFELTSPFWFMHGIDEIFIQEVYKYASYEQEPVILDCGANIGLSVIYFKRLYPKAKVIAFEPDPQIFSILSKNLAEYNYDDVEIVNAAVWNENATLTFESDGSVGGRIDSDKTTGNGIKVKSVRLRDYLTSHVDFLKIDIEGAEYEVLKDCKDLIGNVANLFIEYHVLPNQEQHLHDILDWVHAAGFKYYMREAWDNMKYPFMGDFKNLYQLQLNISCFKQRK